MFSRDPQQHFSANAFSISLSPEWSQSFSLTQPEEFPRLSPCSFSVSLHFLTLPYLPAPHSPLFLPFSATPSQVKIIRHREQIHKRIASTGLLYLSCYSCCLLSGFCIPTKLRNRLTEINFSVGKRDLKGIFARRRQVILTSLSVAVGAAIAETVAASPCLSPFQPFPLHLTLRWDLMSLILGTGTSYKPPSCVGFSLPHIHFLMFVHALGYFTLL